MFRAGLAAADPYAAVLRHVHVDGSVLQTGDAAYTLDNIDHIYVVGAGKADAAMAHAVETLLNSRITGGLLNVKYGHGTALNRIKLNECGHPIPDANGERGAARIAATAQGAGERDLLIVLISGGASALLPLPLPPITLDRKQEITQVLLRGGANIHELNCVRKHLSAIKGGRLAAIAWPARVLTLILSDVIGDDLDVIGSGPTVPDRSTVADATAILRRYGIEPPPLVETPKPGSPVFERVQNVVVGSNKLAVDAAAIEARALGYNTVLLTTFLQGEAREVAHVFAAIAKQIAATGAPAVRPACILAGGETTVTVRGNGRGGRNQELALAAAIDIAGMPGVALLSAGTDGTDGPTDAAGATVSGSTGTQAAVRGIDARAYLDANDSYSFFKSTGELLRTGPTGTNVMDLQVLLVA